MWSKTRSRVRSLVFTALFAVGTVSVLVVTGCTTNHVDGTVVDKTRRMESECVRYSQYRVRGKRRCLKYDDVMHNYLIVMPDGNSTGTVEVKVTADTYDQTTIGSHYSGVIE